MNSLNSNTANDTTSYEFGEQFNSLTSPQTKLESWLMAIKHHANNGSSESRNALLILAREDLPGSELMPVNVQEGIRKIRDIAYAKDLDPNLSPNCKELQKICRDSSPQTERKKSDCARKLFG